MFQIFNLFKRSKIKVLENKSTSGRKPRHGVSGSPTYLAWSNAKHRATLCEEFQEFDVFLKHMGERPFGYRLAKKDKDQPHSPANSFWQKRVIH